MTSETTGPAVVDLYEDNAGTLYLVRGNRIAIAPDAAGATFAEDAADFAATGGREWEGVEIIETSDLNAFMAGAQANLVATWTADDEDFSITPSVIWGDQLIGSHQPGSAASRYLGLD